MTAGRRAGASGARRASAPEAGGFAVDARRPAAAHARRQRRSSLPTEALAAAIAAEWDALEDEIDPDRLPLTRAANSAIDRVAAAARAR